jgi:hypothetical protein
MTPTGDPLTQRTATKDPAPALTNCPELIKFVALTHPKKVTNCPSSDPSNAELDSAEALLLVAWFAPARETQAQI